MSEEDTIYKTTRYSVGHLLKDIGAGRLALPDIQRPFVWKPAQVRDLFDSLYRGFPVGTLMLWETGVDVGTKQVGGGTNRSVPRRLIIDGQQRLTSLYSVISGVPVMNQKFEEKRLHIAFRPRDGVFEVAGAVTHADPEFLSDISDLWGGNFKDVVDAFLGRLRDRRGTPLDKSERGQLEVRLDRVRDIKKLSFDVIEMTEDASEEDVAEIFIRINSKGVSLSQADFVLTLLSVHWDQGRRELERFSRDAKDRKAPGTPANPFLTPSPDQMLRVAVGLAFRRGRMQTIYQLLLGKDLASGDATANRRVSQFERLQRAQKKVLDRAHWPRFLDCLELAGFHSNRMLTSASALLYSYLFWLIGKQDFWIKDDELQRLIARWFFVAHTTARYTSSPESVIDADLRRIEELPPGDGQAFCDLLDGIINSTFTRDFWDITLPSRLDGTGHKSPALSAYWAALSILNAEVLFSHTGVRDLLHPERAYKAAQERQSLFPHLHSRHIGNFVFAEWPADLQAGERAPTDHWMNAIRRLDPERRKRHEYWHALPTGWHQTEDHGRFLENRRRLIARVVQDGFERLSGGELEPVRRGSVADLVKRGESKTVEFKSTARTNIKTGKRDDRIRHAIARSVCAFTNCEGGTLLIGVEDDKTIRGIDEEMARLGKSDTDGYELLIREILETYLSMATMSLVNVEFEEFRGGTVCRIDVEPAPQAVFAKEHQSNRSTFWVRDGNRTTELSGTKMDEFRAGRFGH